MSTTRMSTTGFFARTIATCITLIALGASLAVPTASAAPGKGPKDERPIALELGDSRFWDGELIGSSLIPPFPPIQTPAGPLPVPDGCSAPTAQCSSYDIEILEPGGTLRVALDHSDSRNLMTLSVYDPTGRRRVYVPEAYATESRIRDAAVGMWRAVVVPWKAENETFRMRAYLEPPAAPVEGEPVQLLPDLRVTPPFELTFKGPVGKEAPQSWRIAFGSDAVPSCRVDETAEYGVFNCLRFSSGPENIGDGPLLLRFMPGEGVVEPATMYQDIRWSDGSVTEHDSGTYQYHKEHAHYHHVGFGNIELFRVLDPKRGDIVDAGDGPKQGFCMGPSILPRWDSFDNDEPFGDPSCIVTPPGSGATMGLPRGWGDIYAWFVYGSFVNFGSNDDGLYVMRASADASNVILETDETNNFAYTYFEVTNGRDIEVLERGYGLSPWDRDKELATDIRPLVE